MERSMGFADLRALLRAELAAAEAKVSVLREYLGEAASDDASCVTSDAEFRARTGHSARTVVEAIRGGELPGTKVTHGYRVAIADLRAWELSRTVARRARRSERLPLPEAESAKEIDRALVRGMQTHRRGHSVRSIPPRGAAVAAKPRSR